MKLEWIDVEVLGVIYRGKKGKALSFLSSRIISHIRDKNYTLGL